jgi:hypothetical protein
MQLTPVILQTVTRSVTLFQFEDLFSLFFLSLLTVPGGTNGIGLGGPSATLSSGNVNFLWVLDPSGGPQWTSLESQSRVNYGPAFFHLRIAINSYIHQF